MRERTKDIDRLYHIEESINHVKDFLEGKTFEEMKNDVMCFHAVVYNIMIIGEAANMLTKKFREEHADVPWRNIIDMRNVLVHGYYIASLLFGSIHPRFQHLCLNMPKELLVPPAQRKVLLRKLFDLRKPS